MGTTYVVAEGPDGMYLVDQHAAHERVMYDRLLACRATGAPAAIQPLLEPALLDLGIERAACLEEYRPMLEALGLATEPFGESSYLLRSVPAGISGDEITRTIEALLDKLLSEQRLQDPFAKAAATVACHSSVRAGTALAIEEMRRLIEDLEATPTPRTCPHGRPTLIHLGTDAIERQFGRR
jgi:DNA mismatch repair protein MutL